MRTAAAAFALVVAVAVAGTAAGQMAPAAGQGPDPSSGQGPDPSSGQGPDPSSGQGPDPRKMSGIPRPDEQVPAGVVTVKLIAGQLGRYAPAGTLVHLIAYLPDGNIVRITRPVDAEGRAEFKDLARDGQTVYYAFASWNDDRLESQMITLPPQVGVRVMLAGRSVDEAGKPEGDPIDDAREQGTPETPPGRAEIFLGGRIKPEYVDGHIKPESVASLQVRLVEILPPDAPATAPRSVRAGVTEDDQIVARFTDLPVGNDHVYLATFDSEGHTYRTTPFQMNALAGVVRGIIVTQKLLFGLQGGAQVDDERLWFELGLAIANVTGGPVNPGPDGFVMPLPKGFKNGRVSEEMGGRVIVNDTGVVWRGVIPPGQHDVIVQFSMTVDGGRVVVDMPAPHGMLQSQIAIEKGPGVIVTGEGIAAKPRMLDSGKEFLVLQDVMVRPGGSLRFEITGLPERPAAQRWALWIVGILVLGLIAWAVTAAVMPSRQPGAGGGDTARRELTGQRDRLYAELVNLERRRAAGAVETEVYERERRALTAKLVVVHRELDALDAGGRGKARAPQGE